MARVNITLPDELIGRARAAGLNVSRLASAAVAEELDRLVKIAELDAYLAELEHTLGPAERAGDRGCPGMGRPGRRVSGYGSAVRRRVTLILDSGGLTALAGQRAKLAELRRRGLWPAQVPSVVVTEALTGDHRRDFTTNRILSSLPGP